MCRCVPRSGLRDTNETEHTAQLLAPPWCRGLGAPHAALAPTEGQAPVGLQGAVRLCFPVAVVTPHWVTSSPVRGRPTAFLGAVPAEAAVAVVWRGDRGTVTLDGEAVAR